MKKLFILLSISMIDGACTPTVKVEAPDKPVEINMNIKLDHNITVKVDKDLENVMEDNDEIF